MHDGKRQLIALAEEVDQLHHEGMRTIEDDFAEVHFGEVADRFRESRREFFKKAAIGSGIAIGSSFVPLSRMMPAAFAQDGGGAPTDAELARFAQSVELAAVVAYTAAAESGKLDPAASAVGTIFEQHHREHAEALGGLLGDQAVTEPNRALVDELGAQIQFAPDQTGVLTIAYTVEEGAASTYLSALGVVEADAAAPLATILPVESGHAATLGLILDLPTADYLPSFTTEAAALSPEQYPVA